LVDQTAAPEVSQDRGNQTLRCAGVVTSFHEFLPLHKVIWIFFADPWRRKVKYLRVPFGSIQATNSAVFGFSV
jgi:hypothetical protein